jgi:hypothetical protein
LSLKNADTAKRPHGGYLDHHPRRSIPTRVANALSRNLEVNAFQKSGSQRASEIRQSLSPRRASNEACPTWSPVGPTSSRFRAVARTQQGHG